MWGDHLEGQCSNLGVKMLEGRHDGGSKQDGSRKKVKSDQILDLC